MQLVADEDSMVAELERFLSNGMDEERRLRKRQRDRESKARRATAKRLAPRSQVGVPEPLPPMEPEAAAIEAAGAPAVAAQAPGKDAKGKASRRARPDDTALGGAESTREARGGGGGRATRTPLPPDGATSGCTAVQNLLPRVPCPNCGTCMSPLDFELRVSTSVCFVPRAAATQDAAAATLLSQR
jgi:hypothetical protein